MAEVTIRAAGAGELDRVEPLWAAMAAHHAQVGPADFDYRPAADSWRRRRARYEQWLQEPDARLLLAERDGEAVGYAFLRVGGEEATVVTGRVGDLESLSVAEAHRGQGIGERLVRAAIDHFEAAGATEWGLAVFEGNDRALAFYERFGLRPYVRLLLGRLPGAQP